MSRFGTPESIAKEHIQDLPVDEVIAKMNTVKSIRKTIVIIFAVLAVFLIAYLIGRTLIAWDHSSQYYGEDIITSANQVLWRFYV